MHGTQDSLEAIRSDLRLTSIVTNAKNVIDNRDRVQFWMSIFYLTRNETIFWVLPSITVFQIGLKDLLHRVYDSKCFGQLNYLQWKDWQIANIFSLSSSIWWSHWSEMKESRLQLPASLTSNSKVKTVNVLLRFVIGNQHFIQLKHFVINNFVIRYLISKYTTNLHTV